MSLIEYGHCIIEFIILLQFAGNYLIKKRPKRLSFWSSILATSALLFGINQLKISSLNTMVSLVLGILLLHYLFEGSILAKAGLMSFFMAIMVFLSFATGIVLSSLFQKPVEQIFTHTSDWIIGSISSRIALLLVLRIITMLYHRKGFWYKHNKIDANTGLLLFLPIVSLFTAYLLLYFEQWIPHTRMNTILLSSVCLGLILVNLVVFNIYDSKIENTELKAQLLLAQKYQRYQDDAYKKQEQCLLDMERMAHDFKHYLVSIEGMMESQDEDLKDYIGNLGRTIDQKFMQPFVYSTNRAFNVILYQKQKDCDAYQIDFQANIGYADLSFITYSDTCAIFGNALDNAITACCDILDARKRKYIKLNIHKHNDMLLIDIKNSKSSFQQIIEMNDTIKTTKQEDAYHGFGLANLKTAVQHYGGNVIFDYDDGSFTLMINLPLENEQTMNNMPVRQENSFIS